MRVAVCSDIHGQLERLHEFLAAARSADVGQCWCLGDVVEALGGVEREANDECVRVVEASCALRLAGNHDAWSLQHGLLGGDTAAMCAAWPLGGVTADGVVVVHASPRDPLMEFSMTPPRRPPRSTRFPGGSVCTGTRTSRGCGLAHRMSRSSNAAGEWTGRSPSPTTSKFSLVPAH